MSSATASPSPRSDLMMGTNRHCVIFWRISADWNSRSQTFASERGKREHLKDLKPPLSLGSRPKVLIWKPRSFLSGCWQDCRTSLPRPYRPTILPVMQEA